MRLDVQLDRSRDEALYRQVAESIRTSILAGTFPPGLLLPTVRSLAKQLGIANQTAVSAYRQLAEWGMVEAKVGKGTFVSSQLPSDATKGRLQLLVGLGPIADFEAMSAECGIRSLASAVPDPNLFHADELLAECNALRTGSPWNFYYAPPSGMSELRGAICRLVANRGVQVSEPEVIVTHGCLNGLALVFDELCRPGDRVLVEAPGFLGADLFFRSRGLLPVRISSGPEGLDLDDLDEKASGARVLFCSPTFGATHGRLMPLGQRKELLKLAKKLNLIIVEDEHYAPIAFTAVPPSLFALAEGSRVVQIDSLSGCLSPGVRTGWILCDENLRHRLEDRVRWSGTAGVSFLQTSVGRFLESGKLTHHLRRVIPRYRQRRDAAVSALRHRMPKGTNFAVPSGGLSIWVELPGEFDWQELYRSALGQGAPFAPGPAFDSSGERSSLRVSFGTQEPESITAAIAILGEQISNSLRPCVRRNVSR